MRLPAAALLGCRPNFSSAANAITDKGQIVGSDESTGHAFLGRTGRCATSARRSEQRTWQWAIINQGVIVGNTNTFIDDPLKNHPRDRHRHALVWQKGGVGRL